MADDTFYIWTTSTTTASTTLANWTGWVSDTSGTYATSSAVFNADTAWSIWTTTGTATTYSTLTTAPAYSPEQEAQWKAEREEVQRRATAAEQTRREACERAKRLLDSMLDHQQREQLKKDRFFEVIAKHSRRRYRIRYSTHGNVRLLDDTGREVISYCAQPNGVPTEDSMLAQKLQIEHDEDAFLRVANATRLRAA